METETIPFTTLLLWYSEPQNLDDYFLGFVMMITVVVAMLITLIMTMLNDEIKLTFPWRSVRGAGCVATVLRIGCPATQR